MKYKFKPRTTLIVASLVAATYAEACYYAQTATTTVCFNSGNTVDTLTWYPQSVTKNVIATSDWNHGKQNGSVGYLTSVFSPTGSGQGYVDAAGLGTKPEYCYGPAKFLDAAGVNYVTVSYWQNDDTGAGTGIPGSPLSGGSWGAVSGSTCQP